MPKPSPAAPRVSRPILGWFRWYVRRYLRKAFHTVCLAEPGPPSLPHDAPLIVYLNHAAWWDPLTSILLSELVTPGRTLYAPFDAEALARYPIFGKLGFFGVDQTSRRGAAQFLQTARAILDEPGGSLWMTPEGRFVDPRHAGADFEPGLAHVAASLAREGREAYALPLAMEYAFWEEKQPEALCQFGEPIRLGDHKGLDKPAWNELLQQRLRDSQAELARKSIERNTAAFRVLVGGAEGVGGFYESMRWLKAKATGQRYRKAHSDKLSGDALSSLEGSTGETGPVGGVSRRR